MGEEEVESAVVIYGGEAAAPRCGRKRPPAVFSDSLQRSGPYESPRQMAPKKAPELGAFRRRGQ